MMHQGWSGPHTHTYKLPTSTSTAGGGDGAAKRTLGIGRADASNVQRCNQWARKLCNGWIGASRWAVRVCEQGRVGVLLGSYVSHIHLKSLMFL